MNARTRTIEAPHQGAVPDHTRRMMVERMAYTFEVKRASWAVYGYDPAELERHTITSTPDDVAELACERLARAVKAIAPRYARALLRDELLVWRFPVTATFHRSPQSQSALEDAHFESSLYTDGSPRERALWCLHSVSPQGWVPVSFPVDVRAVYEREPIAARDREPIDNEMLREMSERGVRDVEPWSHAWPPGVDMRRVCEMLRASEAPEASDVADDIRGVTFGGPDVMARLGARVGPVETREQRRARHDSVLCRWADTVESEGYAVPVREPDAEGIPSHVFDGRSWTGLLRARMTVIARDAATLPRWLVDQAAETILQHHRDRWSPVAVAHIADAIDRIDRGQRDARMFALPAAQEPRVVFEMMARAESFVENDVRRASRAQRVMFRVLWDGRPNDRGQLAFGFACSAPSADVFRDILSELGAEGLRDYVILHRMAAEQGRTGRFRWTWEAHKRATAHEARVRTGGKRDSEAKRETLARIARLRSAELHAEAEDGRGRRAWRVVGEAPLVSIVGGVEARGGDVEGLELVLNPALYDGAATRGEREGRFFALLPEAVLSLPALSFSLAVMLAFRWRYAHDVGGIVDIPKTKLQEYMAAGRWRTGNVAAAEETLSRALARVAEAYGAGCAFDDNGDTVRAHPGAAWTAAVVDRAPPLLPASTASVPRTGAELRAWRDSRKLSQRDAAESLGVGLATVKRAELAADVALPRAFKRARWSGAPAEGGGSRGDGA